MGLCYNKCPCSLKFNEQNEIITHKEENILNRKKFIGPFYPKEPEDKEGPFVYNIFQKITIIESGQ